MNRERWKKTLIPLVLGAVGDTVVTLVCEAFVGVVTKIDLEMSVSCIQLDFSTITDKIQIIKNFIINYYSRESSRIFEITIVTYWCKK